LLARDLAGVTLDINGVERFDIASAGGADTVVVGALTGTDVAAVRVDLGADGLADSVTPRPSPSARWATACARRATSPR
jgi:hypothetical protein